MKSILLLWAQQLAGLPLEFLRTSIVLLFAALIFVPIERRFGRGIKFSQREYLSQDLAYLYLGALLPPFIAGTVAVMLQPLILALSPRALHDAFAAWPIWAILALVLVCGELGYYWVHRWAHEIPWLWRFHAIHHSPQRLDWLVNTRVHPVDLGLTRAIAGIPAGLLGLSISAGAGASVREQLFWAAGFAVGSSFWAFFIHLNVRWRLGAFEWLLTTPAFHHWHHANDDATVLNKNYAALLPVMDRLFGTHHLPARYPAVYGSDTALPGKLWGQIVFPFMRSKRP